MIESHSSTAGGAALTPIAAASVEFLEDIDFDVFTLGPKGQPVLFCNREHRPDLAAWIAATEQGTSRLYIKTADQERWRTQVRNQVDRWLEQDTLPPVRQFEILQSLMDDSLRASHELGHVGHIVEQTQQTAPQLVSILSRGVAVTDLFQILRHDFDTFSHVVNVASYCVLLARESGIHDPAELEKIAVGGLLHDLGKRVIPSRILAKRGPLTPQEREIIQQHPQRGYEDLQGRDDMEFGQLMMAYQHHERIDGRGYPVQIPGKEMHPWSRLCAVCDVFEALTAERPYRKAMTLAAGLEFLQEHSGTHFDGEMVTCWISAINRVPSTHAGAPCR